MPDNAAEDRAESRFETLAGVLLAIFAAILAWSDLGGSNVDEDRTLSSHGQVSTYSWYQSKSIKQSLAQNQYDILAALAMTGLSDEQTQKTEQQLAKLEAKIERYEKEQQEILQGSSVVGEENWAQDIGGKLGIIIGADQYKARVEQLNAADNIYDKAGLLLQLAIVMGALSLVFKQRTPRFMFLGLLIVIGLIGTAISISGYLYAQRIG